MNPFRPILQTSRITGALFPAIALLIGSGLAVGTATPAHAQAAPFLDTPANHWAYDSVQDLAKKGILLGYPDGTYSGKRPMTRYEFAVAINWMLLTLDEIKTARQNGVPPPAAHGLTQDDLNRLQALVDKFRPQLDTIQTNLRQAQDNIDALRADVLDAKAPANKAKATAGDSYEVGADRKFQISGYVQARFQAASAGQGALDRFPQGVAGGAGSYNGNSVSGSSPRAFEVRRARVKFSAQVTGSTRYAVQVDTSAAVTAGLFPNPFGYILSASSSAILSPERPLAFGEGAAGIFNLQDYDKGIQLGYSTRQRLLFLPAGLKLTPALVNGAGRSGDATDAFMDQI